MTRFEQLLTDKGITRYALAKRTGISIGSIEKLWTGKSTINKLGMANAYRIARALNMSLDEFFAFFMDSENPILAEGWNDITDTFSVLVEDGLIKRGLKTTSGDQVPLYPYRWNAREQIYDRWDYPSIKDYDRIEWQ